MALLELFIVALFGCIVGSFLNVYILRLNTGRSTTGRSGCMSCRKQLTWQELIPVISFFMLRGRCRGCGSRISHQYWIVEILTALLFVCVWLQGLPLIPAVLMLVLVSELVVIAVYDIKHTIIPNTVVYPFLLTALLLSASLLGTYTPKSIALYVAVSVINGVIVALPLLLLWVFSRGRWMGLGDVKLVLGFGMLLGVYYGLMAMMLGFVIGAVVGLFLLYAPRVIKHMSLSPTSTRFTMKSEIPFAPFLIVGFFLVLFFNADLITLVGYLI